MATQHKSVRLTKPGVIEGGLVVEGNLHCTENLWVDGDLSVSGSVHACGNIVVAGDAEVGGDVVGRGIVVRGSLRAKQGAIRAAAALRVGGDVIAGTAVEARGAIRAGGSLRAGWWVISDRFDLVCTELETGRLPFGRGFWAEQPSLRQWRDAILDPAKCWDDWRAMFSDEQRAWLAGQSFGHWSIDAQVSNFLGLTTRVIPPEGSLPRSAAGRPVSAPAPVPPAPPARPGGGSNALQAIVQDPVVTPFPDYSGNGTYEQIVKTIGIDPRTAYPDLNIALAPLYDQVNGLTVGDPAVKAQILAELQAAMNIRDMVQNQTTFIQEVFFSNSLRVTYVGNMVSAESDDQCGATILSIFLDVLSALGTIPDVGAVFTIFGAVVGLLEAGFGGGVGDVNARYDELVGALSTQFNNALSANGQMGSKLLTDWGKMQKADALIMDGTLKWPIDDSAAVLAAGNRYEVNVFKILLPLHWWPTFSDFDFGKDTRSGCGNTVWMQPGGWGDVDGQGWVPYWITYGGYWWGDLSQAEDELAKLGVSIENLTMGTGAWGPTIWAWNRQNPLGAEERPSCVGKG